MIRPILIHPDPRLKKACEPVAEITDEVKRLAADMLETMYDAPGIGLAAPQVGVMKRVLVMDCIKDGPPEPMVLVNPVTVWQSEDVSTYEEGCLSIPDQYADVKRPAAVTVRWTGWMARRRSGPSRACGPLACSTRWTIWRAGCSSIIWGR